MAFSERPLQTAHSRTIGNTTHPTTACSHKAAAFGMPLALIRLLPRDVIHELQEIPPGERFLFGGRETKSHHEGAPVWRVLGPSCPSTTGAGKRSTGGGSTRTARYLTAATSSGFPERAKQSGKQLGSSFIDQVSTATQHSAVKDAPGRHVFPNRQREASRSRGWR